MSLPPTVALREPQLSADGQQLSPGKHLHLQVAFGNARESVGVAQTPRDRREYRMLLTADGRHCRAEEGERRPPAYPAFISSSSTCSYKLVRPLCGSFSQRLE